ncbi:MAG: glycosyltransferase family 2 protein [Pirellulaceae bacterium]
MNYVLPVLATVTLLACLIHAIRMFLGNRRLVRLADVEPAEPPLPRVSVVVAARNEERHIEAGIRSLLQLDYDNLEIMVVNDRSEDRTGEILDQIAEDDSALRVEHLTELPDGWLGKNHALYFGALRASGDFLLFTDADVVMHPSALRRAVGYATREEIDHLPMLFRVTMPNWLLECFTLVFFYYFWAFVRPWKVKDPQSGAHVGAGGFNLIRADVYEKIGTYQAIALRPDDDIKLGKIVKKHGFRQELLMATEHVRVPGYPSLRDAVNGLEKNLFSGVDYRIGITVLSSLIALAFHVFPFVAVFVTTGVTRWLYLGVVAVLLLSCCDMARIARIRISCSLGFPLGVLMFVFVQWRTMLVNLYLGGIRWRGTFYSLAELKTNKV